LLSCTCATCIFLAEHYLKMKRENDAEMKKLEAEIFAVECRMKKKWAAKKLAADADDNKCPTAADTVQKKRRG